MSTVRVESGEASAEPTFTSARPLDYAPGIVLLIVVGLLWPRAAKCGDTPDVVGILSHLVCGRIAGIHRLAAWARPRAVPRPVDDLARRL